MTSDIWVTTGIHADHATSRVSVGRSDWPPKYWCGSVGDVWGPRGIIGDLSSRR